MKRTNFIQSQSIHFSRIFFMAILAISLTSFNLKSQSIESLANVTLKDTIDESNTFEFKYNRIIYDSLMKPLTGILINKNGILGEFINGKRMGIHRYFLENGLIGWEAQFNNGLADGYWKCYDEKGKVKYETTFVQGTGIDITINDKGDTLYIAQYVNGKLHGELKRYFDDNGLMYSTIFTHGTGIDKRYYQNKNLAFEQPLIDGKENGTYKEFYENGIMKRIIEFKNGLPNGEIIYWDENGNEISKTKFKDGIYINE